MRFAIGPRIALALLLVGAAACYETPKPECTFKCGQEIKSPFTDPQGTVLEFIGWARCLGRGMEMYAEDEWDYDERHPKP